MTAVPCPANGKCGLFATTWTLLAHLVEFHSYSAEEAIGKAAGALERELDGSGHLPPGRTTRSWGTRGT